MHADASRPSAVQLLFAWVILLGSVGSCWLLRPGHTPHSWTGLQTLFLFLGGKTATLVCLTRAQWRDLSPGRFLAYLIWPALQPRLFCRSHKPQPNDIVPTWSGVAFNLGVGLCFLYLFPLLLPNDAPLLLRGWLGLIGTSMISLFALFDLWVILYRMLGIGVEKLWFMPGGSTSLADFWGRRWNRIFSGIVRDLLFNPLRRRLGVVLALLAVFLYSGFVHENVSVAIESGYGKPTLYFLIQWLGLLAEHTPWGKSLLRARPWLGRLWAFVVVLGPVALLVQPDYVREVIMEDLRINLVPGIPPS